MRVSESGGVDERRQTEAGPFSASGGPGLTALRGIWNALGASASAPGRAVSLRSTDRWLSPPHERCHDPTAWAARDAVAHLVCCGVRDLDATRALNQSPLTFDQWLAQKKSRLPPEQRETASYVSNTSLKSPGASDGPFVGFRDRPP